MLKEEFSGRVQWIEENIFSMTGANRKRFSKELGTVPYLLDAREFGDMRRPWLYWTSWPLRSDDRCTILKHADYFEVRLTFQGPPAGHWVEAGWHRDGEATWMCTLTRRLPKKTFPDNAVGLGSASETAKARWQADNYAFQVYQYEDRFLLFNSEGEW